MALIGHVDEISRSVIEGWAIDDSQPDEPVSLSIFVDDMHRGMCLTTYTRTDLVLPGGEKLSGKRAFHFEFDPPLSPFIALRIEVRETWTHRILPNGVRTLPRPNAGQGGAGLVPILLTSTGRTGTTLLMSEFVRHANIVAGDHFPYEIKQIAYHAAAFRALAAHADRERSTTPETMLAPEMNRIIGSNPYHQTGLFGLGGPRDYVRDFWHSTVPSGFATLFRGFILEFYATLAKAQGKQSAIFFCEKADIDEAAVQAARLFFDVVKDIVIVRDPRDLLCSAIAFWKLRPELAMTMLATTIPRLRRTARAAGPDTVVIRYEDLVRDPRNTRLALSGFLDLDLMSAAGPAALPDSHRTSRDPAASIGRWRNDLTAEQASACEAAFGQFMREFDYPLTDRGTRPARPNHETVGHQVVAAEGGIAVAAFVADTESETEDGIPSRLVLELTFGRQGNAEGCAVDGWSTPERGFVWSCASESTVRLPAVRQRGDYRLHITAAPFTHGTVLPAQRVTILLDGREVATAMARQICLLSIPLPDFISLSDQAVTLTLIFPDASRPAEIAGGSDQRLLGFSLHRVALARLEAKPEIDPRDSEVAARLLATIQRALRQPDLRYHALTALRELPGFDATSFARLILGVEAEFGVALHEDEVDSIRTMGDIATLLIAKTRGVPDLGGLGN